MSNLRFPNAPPSLPPGVEIPEDLLAWVQGMEMWATSFHRITENAIGQLLDSARPASAALLLPPATLAELETNNPPKFKPAVPRNGGCSMVYCTDATAGAVPCYSDGTNWRQVTDGIIVS